VVKVNLQKSQYSNLYYFRNSFTILAIDPTGKNYHIGSGMASNEIEGNMRYSSKQLLDLENTTEDGAGKEELEYHINKFVKNEIEPIKSIEDLYFLHSIGQSGKIRATVDLINYYKSLGYDWQNGVKAHRTVFDRKCV